MNSKTRGNKNTGKIVFLNIIIILLYLNKITIIDKL